MNYSYEEDTYNLGGRSPGVETKFQKLSWPKDVDFSDDRRARSMTESNRQQTLSDPGKKFERPHIDENMRQREGDEFDEEEPEGSENGGETNGEDLPVFPKVPVKRKLVSEPRSAERSTQRGRPKSRNLQTKKQRTPPIDASVITQLEFGKRPPNCVSIVALPLCIFC